MKIKMTCTFSEFFAFKANDDFDTSIIEEIPEELMNPYCELDGLEKNAVLETAAYGIMSDCVLIDESINETITPSDSEYAIDFFNNIISRPKTEINSDNCQGLVVAKMIEDCDNTINLGDEVTFNNYEPNSWFSANPLAFTCENEEWQENLEEFCAVTSHNKAYDVNVYYIPFNDRLNLLKQLLIDFDFKDNSIKNDISSLISEMENYKEKYPILNLGYAKEDCKFDSYENFIDFGETWEDDGSEKLIEMRDLDCELSLKFASIFFNKVSQEIDYQDIEKLIKPYSHELEMESTSGGDVEWIYLENN